MDIPTVERDRDQNRRKLEEAVAQYRRRREASEMVTIVVDDQQKLFTIHDVHHVDDGGMVILVSQSDGKISSVAADVLAEMEGAGRSKKDLNDAPAVVLVGSPKDAVPTRQRRESGEDTPSSVEAHADKDREGLTDIPDVSRLDRIDDAARHEADTIRDRLQRERIDRTPTGSDAAAEYVHKHLPVRFQKAQPIAAAFQRTVSVAVRILETLGTLRIEGRGNVPREGGYLVVSNHSRFSDPVKLLALLNRPAHLVNADMHFRAGSIQRWFLNGIGAIEVESTLSNLSDEEQQKLLLRVPSGAQAYYRTVIARDHDATMRRQQIMKHRAFLKTTVATLVSGEPVVMFPEGLWLYEEQEHALRKAYGGVDHIAREYRNVTGNDLPILPVALSDGSARVSDVMLMSAEMSIDAVMQRIAALLPEHERGYYR